MSKVNIQIVRANYGDDTGVRVIVDGKLIATGEYGGEPEDNTEYRTYSWVKDVLADLAKALGAEVAIESIDVGAADPNKIIAGDWQAIERKSRDAYYRALYEAPKP